MTKYSHLFAPLAAQDALVYFCFRPVDGQVLYVSPAYERELGGNIDLVNEELPQWLEALHPDDRHYLAERMALVLHGEPARNLELRVQQPEGKLRWLCLSAFAYRPSEPDSGLLISGHVREVTRFRNVLELSRRFQTKKNSMLEILSHDLASPLVLAQQLSDYIAERVQSLQDERLNAMLEEMRRSCIEGINLIRDFVDQEFLESSNVDLHLERLEMVGRVQVLIDNYRNREHAAGHRFHFEASQPTIYAVFDENKFMQVINNLLGNSLKFTPDGGLLSVLISQQADHVLITVADTGIGIPEALQPGLFERFTRSRRVGLRGEKTTGLGMSIIKTIVELHRGRIWLESEEGKGTSFYIRLPAA